MIWLCAIVLVASSVASCQPPQPRIAKGEVPSCLTTDIAETKDFLTASSRSERTIQLCESDGSLMHDVSRHR